MANQQPSLNIEKSFLLQNEDECIYALVGCLLGDSSIESKTKYIVTSHSIINKDYTVFKYNEFIRFLKIGTLGISNNYGTNPDLELRKSYRFRINDKELSSLLEPMFYNKYRNRLLPDLSFFNEISLFFWYMDDGCLIIRNNGSYIRRSLKIALKSLCDQDILNLVKFLKTKYNLNFRVEYNTEKTKIIKILMHSEKDIAEFFNLLYKFYKFIPTSMYYKFNPQFSKKDLCKFNIIEGSTTIEK